MSESLSPSPVFMIQPGLATSWQSEPSSLWPAVLKVTALHGLVLAAWWAYGATSHQRLLLAGGLLVLAMGAGNIWVASKRRKAWEDKHRGKPSMIFREVRSDYESPPDP